VTSTLIFGIVTVDVAFMKSFFGDYGFISSAVKLADARAIFFSSTKLFEPPAFTFIATLEFFGMPNIINVAANTAAPTFVTLYAAFIISALHTISNSLATVSLVFTPNAFVVIVATTVSFVRVGFAAPASSGILWQQLFRAFGTSAACG
jgi:hypothetical protein